MTDLKDTAIKHNLKCMTLDQVLNCKVLDLGYSYSSAKPSLVKEKVPEQVGLESQASLVKEMMTEQVGLESQVSLVNRGVPL